jgi:hypothetical protein
MIELLAALFILLFGILSTLRVFESSNRATSVSEAQQAEVHQAQREIERLQSLSYGSLGLTARPATSASVKNPGYYVSSGSCPTYSGNLKQSAPAAPLVINGCEYEYEGTYGTVTKPVYSGGTVEPEKTWAGSNKLAGTIYDYVTWETDPNCNPGPGCAKVNDYKRITVAVTNNTTVPGITTAAPVVVTALVVNPETLPLKGQPKSENPLESTEIKCTNGAGETVKCNYGLGTQTANIWYLTDSPAETGYQTPAEQTCMHYTVALVPTVCGQAAEASKCSLSTKTYTSCPQADLLGVVVPSSATEYNFSPNLSATTAGRVIKRDSKATGASPCSVAPSENAEMGMWWATAPLEKALKLSGNGGITLYTRTLKEVAASATLCVAVYAENPVKAADCSAVLGPNSKALLDPLNKLNSTCSSTQGRSDSETLGTVSYTANQWPGELTPTSFTFNYMSSAKEVAAGTALAVRVWPAATSEDDLVVQYDAQAAQSTFQLDSE